MRTGTHLNDLVSFPLSPSTNHHRVSPRSRFMSQPECDAFAEEVRNLSVGGGSTWVGLESHWIGNLRWAKNIATTSGDVRTNNVTIGRLIRGSRSAMRINQVNGPAVEAAVRRAERVIELFEESADPGVEPPLSLEAMKPVAETHTRPNIWSETTYQLDADHRADVMRELVRPAVDAGMIAAGYLEVSAHGRSVNAVRGTSMYYPYTQAQYSVTIRNPEGTGSGWAGVDHNDWTAIDATTISEIALDKCLRSRNPVAVEPGRWTVILEPQAVCDLTAMLFSAGMLMRTMAEGNEPHPFGTGKGVSRIGERIVDERITVSMDCMDPDLGFPPFWADGSVFYPAKWIEQGVLKQLSYDRFYAVEDLGLPTALPSSGAYRMSGGTATIDEMVATTARGLVITRFSGIQLVDFGSMLMTGYTRDGVWLVERGKITKPVKNFRFTDSPLFMLNNVEQLGIPRRVFHPEAPVVVPAIKARDFSLTSLADAV